jgi:hypothetical protein
VGALGAGGSPKMRDVEMAEIGVKAMALQEK